MTLLRVSLGMVFLAHSVVLKLMTYTLAEHLSRCPRDHKI